MDKVAASGGYMMACIAEKIVAAPFAVIGSIGVLVFQDHHPVIAAIDAEETQQQFCIFFSPPVDQIHRPLGKLQPGDMPDILQKDNEGQGFGKDLRWGQCIHIRFDRRVRWPRRHRLILLDDSDLQVFDQVLELGFDLAPLFREKYAPRIAERLNLAAAEDLG